MSDDDAEVRHEPEHDRYTLFLGDETAGVAQYQEHGDWRVFTHTVVDDRYEGMGLGSRLVRYALDDTKAAGRRIVPRCPFVRAYVEKHHDWDDLVDQPTKALLASLPD
ncbi:GNAT family N-acetyltransferase [Naasia sp. SYSU D00057]|uniref:GNAT family N-acetyltransferase n=1 Tax=Naasia sp. SYSU D00057 TaxID=2817380 RepID=UPI001B30652A|nr:GNAT family N-acetyltransferase [Naasia sp. SYSU D00057]